MDDEMSHFSRQTENKLLFIPLFCCEQEKEIGSQCSAF